MGKADSRFQPYRVSGRVENHPQMQKGAHAGFDNHKRVSGSTTGEPVDPRVGSQPKYVHGRVPVHGGMVHKGTDGTLRTGGGDMHSALADGGQPGLGDFLSCPPTPRGFKPAPAAYGHRSRTHESFDDVGAPGVNHAKHAGKGAADADHALGQAIIRQAIKSGSDHIG
jgi:hypothetical protein